MNLNLKKTTLVTGCLGCLALALRLALLRLGTDEKGLLIAWHPLELLAWAVTAAAIGWILWTAWPLTSTEIHCAPVPAALGCLALAAGIALATLAAPASLTRMEQLRNLSGLLCVPALIWAAWCRLGKKPCFFGCHVLVCLHLTLFAICRYQYWCSQSQLQNCIFTMAGAIVLALFAYDQAALDVGMGKQRPQMITGLAAAFCCLAALANGEVLPLYLGGALWALTNLWCPAPRETVHETA